MPVVEPWDAAFFDDFHKSLYLRVKHIVFLAVAFGVPCKSQGVALRNNLLWDATGTANLGIEIPVAEHWTAGANGAIKTWPRFFVWDTGTVDNPRQWKYFTAAPEVRFWPGEIYSGWFFGADLIYTHYNASKLKLPLGLFSGLEKERRQGNFYGGGIFAGHSWWLGEHFRIEAEAGIGAGHKDATRYDCMHCGTKLGNEGGLQIVPKLGINIAWNLSRRKEARKAVQDVIEEIVPVKVEEPVVAGEVEKEQETVTGTVPVAKETEYVKSAAEVLAPEHPILHPAEDYTPYTRDMVIRKMKGALFVYYEFGKSEVKREVRTLGSLRDNGPVLDEVIEVSRKVLADTISSISKIQIVGLASFEGGRWGNERLSLARAKALKDYVQGKLDVPDEMFEIYGGGEAWTDLRDQLADLLAAGGGIGLTAGQLQKAIDIIDGEKDPDRREVLLREADSGVIYSKIRRGVFADQRSAGYLRIFYEVRK